MIKPRKSKIVTASQEDAAENVIPLELTDEVKREQIVTSYIYDIEIDSICLELNHKYNKKKITSPIESKWPKTMETFIEEMKRRGIAKIISHYCRLDYTILTAYPF
jgi:hypothetical protein